MQKFIVTSAIKNYPDKLPYEAIKNSILGARYDLSLSFVGATRAKTLNQTYRQKDYAPNVLSFPLTESTGEIYICPAVTKSEAKKFNLSPDGYIAFLFIHGCLHLKGHDHSDAMDKLESKYLKLFKIS